jgi:thiosulfate dehydrogenase
MPLWSRQTTNTLSGPDTWRCVTCHGWDYQGKDGAYRSGGNYTGFPGLLQSSQKLTKEQIIDQLSGKRDPAHDYSKLLAANELSDLADFIKGALVDDNQFINPQTLDVIGGDQANGEKFYKSGCASCHGDDGSKLKIRFEGLDAGLGTLAALDPWRFLHKTRFGTPGTQMPLHATAGWTAKDGRDVLLYAQVKFKTGQEKPVPGGALIGRENPEASPGGPANTWLTGLLTGLGAIGSTVGFALLIGGVLVGIIFLVVWVMRGRQ